MTDPDESARMVADHTREISKQFIGQPATPKKYEDIRKAIEQINQLGGPPEGYNEHVEIKWIGDSINLSPKTERGEEIIREMMNRLVVQEIHES
jgi:hypothetical protein